MYLSVTEENPNINNILIRSAISQRCCGLAEPALNLIRAKVAEGFGDRARFGVN